MAESKSTGGGDKDRRTPGSHFYMTAKQIDEAYARLNSTEAGKKALESLRILRAASKGMTGKDWYYFKNLVDAVMLLDV